MKKFIAIIGIFFIIGIIIFSIKSFDEKDNKSSIQDIITEVLIDNYSLSIKYVEGNMIDETISFGNKYGKNIEITNNNDVDLSYSLSIKETIINNEILYDVYYATNKDNFINVSKSVNLVGDANLAYNLVIPKMSTIVLKVDFIGNHEGLESTLKGVLNVGSNLTEKDVFKQKLINIQSELNDKINSLNGINVKGRYIIDLSNFSDKVKSEFSGFILIDATDISFLEFYYFIYNSNYMVYNSKYSIKNFDKKYIKDIDINTVSSISRELICSLHTRNQCDDFNTLTYDANGGKQNFYNGSKKIIDLVKKDFNLKDKKVFIYDVENDIKNDTNIRGYILINNMDVNNPEYYLYLTNDYFMISGYNLTKLGDYSSDSATIRAYNETAFKLSSENISKVCSFSGFSECYNIHGEKVF